MKCIEGIIVPLLTPIREDETPDYGGIEKLTDYVIEGGVDAVFACGTSGEFARFTESERREILKVIVNAAGGRVPVLAGVSDCGTRLTIGHIRDAEAIGADAVVTTMPYYFPTGAIREQISFIKDVTAATDLSVILYNIPATAGCSVSVDALSEVMDIANLYGIKDTSGDRGYYDRLEAICATGLKLFMGNEAMSFYGLTHGARGLVPSLANAFPRLLTAIWQSALSADWEACRHHADVLDGMNRLNNANDSWMCPNIWRKEALKQMGVIGAAFTRPYIPLSDEAKEQVAQCIGYYRDNYEARSLREGRPERRA